MPESVASRRVRRVLIANRGEIAVRIVRTCREMGIETVVATSTVDRDGLAARLADRSVCIGPPAAGASYLHIPSVVAAALGTGCDAVHPGYGFLSENPEFAQTCVDHGLVFVGPAPHVVAEAGDKARAREIARAAGIPVLSGSPIVDTVDAAVGEADRLGYPVLIKAAAGGGGRGMVVIESAEQLRARFTAAASESQSAFGDGRLYLERYIRHARHIEVQVLGDRHGHVVHLGERDCTLQRRHQKVVEESPAPALTPAVRDAIRASGVAFASAIGLDSAGTVEFVFDADTGGYAFLEFNARIQVEHPVTEMVTGVDLVRQQFLSAQGDPLEFAQHDIVTSGHAIEVRITSESPREGFMPRPGVLTAWKAPEGPGVRVDTHAEPGLAVSPYYDSLLAKVIAHGSTRDDAADRMQQALADLHVDGLPTTAEFAAFTLADRDFREARVTTTWIADVGLPRFLDTAEATR